MNKKLCEYNRIYIVTDFRKDVKSMAEACEIEEEWKTRREGETEVIHLRTDVGNFRGYHFKEDDLVIMGRVRGPAENVNTLMDRIENYPPKTEEPEIIYETG